MYIIKTCRPKKDLVQRYPPVVTTAVCRLCGERFRLLPIEFLTNRTGLASGNYVCPLCRRLMDEAENSISNDLDFSNLFPQSTAIPFSIRRMTDMEDQYDDSNEEESDSDEAANDKYDGACGMCPPSDENPDAEECGDDEIPLEADLWIQVHVHLTIHRDRQNK